MKGLRRMSDPIAYTEATYIAGPDPIDLPNTVISFNEKPATYLAY
jgi:hypothetical protein